MIDCQPACGCLLDCTIYILELEVQFTAQEQVPCQSWSILKEAVYEGDDMLLQETHQLGS